MGWNRSQGTREHIPGGTREHIPGVGTDHRGQGSHLLVAEPRDFGGQVGLAIPQLLPLNVFARQAHVLHFLVERPRSVCRDPRQDSAGLVDDPLGGRLEGGPQGDDGVHGVHAVLQHPHPRQPAPAIHNIHNIFTLL
eukprot:1186010-Prorocentrum_minimum.AAC.1